MQVIITAYELIQKDPTVLNRIKLRCSMQDALHVFVVTKGLACR